jgi:hypothetical protein
MVLFYSLQLGKMMVRLQKSNNVIEETMIFSVPVTAFLLTPLFCGVNTAYIGT